MYISLSNGKNYRLNMENIIKYCSNSGNDKATQSNVMEMYQKQGKTFEIVQKEITTSSIRNGQLDTIDTYRYDLINGLLKMLFGMGFNNTAGAVTKDLDIESSEISIAESITWNTLISLGFLEEFE